MTDTDDPDDATRRWLLRALVALGFGIPIAVEGATLVGMLDAQLFGGGVDGDADEAPAETPTTAGEPVVAVGDELLPGTDPAETLEAAVVRPGGDGQARRFEVEIAVENTGERPYELRLGGLQTAGGTRVEGGASTDRLDPGDSATLAATYDLPDGETPGTLSVVGAETVGTGERLTQRTVRFEAVPVRPP
jgi:hypothetical protein